MAATVMGRTLCNSASPKVSSTLIYAGVGRGIQFAILFAIDHETRWLIRSIINEGKSKLGITQFIDVHKR
jgi:hypothetical protein